MFNLKTTSATAVSLMIPNSCLSATRSANPSCRKVKLSFSFLSFQHPAALVLLMFAAGAVVQGMQGTVYRTNGDGITTVCNECANHSPATTHHYSTAPLTTTTHSERRVINPPSLTFSAPYVSQERVVNIQPSRAASGVTTYTTTTYYTDYATNSRQQADGGVAAVAAGSCSRCAGGANVDHNPYGTSGRVVVSGDSRYDECNYHFPSYMCTKANDY